MCKTIPEPPQNIHISGYALHKAKLELEAQSAAAAVTTEVHTLVFAGVDWAGVRPGGSCHQHQAAPAVMEVGCGAAEGRAT